METIIVIYGIILLVILHDLCKQEEEIEIIFNNENEILRMLKDLEIIKEVEKDGKEE